MVTKHCSANGPLQGSHKRAGRLCRRSLRMKADITAVAPCLVKVAGRDAKTFSDAAKLPYVALDAAATIATPAPDAVKLLNESVTVSAFKGDRLIIGDVGRITNNCNYPLTVSLKADAQFGSAVTAGDWTDLAMDVYLGKKNAGVSATDFALAADWDATPIHVQPAVAAAGVVTNASTGVVVIPAGEDRQIGFRIDAGTTAVAKPATLRWTVSALN